MAKRQRQHTPARRPSRPVVVSPVVAAANGAGDTGQDAEVTPSAPGLVSGASTRGDGTAPQPTQRRQGPSATRATLYRLRRQLLPWKAGVALHTVAAVTWAADWVTQGAATPAITLGTTVAAFGAAGVGLALKWDCVRASRWRRRIQVAAWSGAGWVSAASVLGPSWGMTWTLAAGTCAVGAGYWRDVRITARTPQPVTEPTEPTEPVEVPDHDDIVDRWVRRIARAGGPLPGARLTDRETGNGVTEYTIELVQGKQTHEDVRQAIPRIASGLRMNRSQIEVRAHDSGDESLAVITFVWDSPVKQSLEVSEPEYIRDGTDSRLGIGMLADGSGRVYVPLYAEDSMRNMAMIGGQGSGKSALMSLIALTAMTSGHTCVWYLDGQDGVSSPELLEHADWAPTGPDREEVMLSALERIAAARGAALKAMRARGFTPSASLPGLLVVMDECHVFLKGGQTRRWGELIRISRKLGIGFVVGTQQADLASFGDELVRSLLLQTTLIVLRLTSNTAKQILSLPVNPGDLPADPGYGYHIRGYGKNSTAARFRADYLGDTKRAEALFAQHCGVTLDPLSARAAGDAYTRRREIAQQRQRELAELLDSIAAGGTDLSALDALVDTTLHSQTDDTDSENGLPTLKLPKLTVIPGGHTSPVEPNNQTDPVSAAEAVLHAVGDGQTRTRDIHTTTGLSKATVHRALTDLVESGQLVKVGHGTYELT